MSTKIITSAIAFLFLHGTGLSQKNKKEILVKAPWSLTSGQNETYVFSADTLVFVNSNKHLPTDSVYLNLQMQFETDKEFHFFRYDIDIPEKNTMVLSTVEGQPGRWSLNRDKTKITLKISVPEIYAGETRTTTRAIEYSIFDLTSDKLAIKKIKETSTHSK